MWLRGTFKIHHDPNVLSVLFYYGVDYRANRWKNDYKIKSSRLVARMKNLHFQASL